MTGKKVFSEAVIKIYGLNHFRMLEFRDNEATVKTETRERFGDIQYTSIEVGEEHGERVMVQVRTDALIEALRLGGLSLEKS